MWIVRRAPSAGADASTLRAETNVGCGRRGDRAVAACAPHGIARAVGEARFTRTGVVSAGPATPLRSSPSHGTNPDDARRGGRSKRIAPAPLRERRHRAREDA